MNVKGIMDGKIEAGNTNCIVKEDVNDDSISIGSVSEDSMNSVCSSSSSELAEDASSSSASYLSTSSSHSNGPLFELSELMSQLPIKRGLSMFYQGKAQSFSSLASVESIGDLPKKKERFYRKKMKSCKSFAGGLDSSHRISFAPKATISKKSSRATFVSVLTKRGSFLGGSRTSFSVHKNF